MKEIPFRTIVDYFDKSGWNIYQIPQREDKVALISDWNRVHRSMIDYLENYYHLAFDDEATSCSDCGYFVDLTPDYRGSPDWFLTEYDVVCRECFEKNPEAYLDVFIHYAGDPPIQPKAVYSWMKKAFEDAGFVPFNSEDSMRRDSFETGLHAGQHDTPEEASDLVYKELGPVEMIFFIDSANLFSVYWSVYVRRAE